MIPLRKSISLRLLRYVFGCFVAVTLVVTALQLLFEYNHVKRTVLAELVQLQNSFANGLSASLWDYSPAQLDSILSGMHQIEKVSGVKVVDERDALLASVGHVVSQDVQVSKVTTLEQQQIREIEVTTANGPETLFEYRFPIEYDDRGNTVLLGYGYLYLNHKTIIGSITYTLTLIVINSVIKTLALWAIFIFFIHKVLVRPLNALTGATQALNPDDPETLSESKSLEGILEANHADELNILATKFIEMRGAILNKIDLVEHQNKVLDARVEERTRDLARSNDALTKVNAELEHLSLHDPLTGLPNRTLFNDRLSHQLQVANRYHSEFIVLSIDLRRFKNINDDFGHQIGDKVLKESAARMAGTLRKADTIARMGGDEFAAILAGADAAYGEQIAQKLLDALVPPMRFGEHSIEAFANIGIATFPTHGTTAKALFNNADDAMYQAKRAEQGFALFSTQISSTLSKQRKLRDQIPHAIQTNQFELHYQPIIALRTNSIIGVEALVRWNHPVFGVIPPVEFIGLAEHSGMIEQLTEWVFETACTQCREWYEQGYEFRISINLSRRSFSDADLSTKLRDTVLRHGLDTNRIHLEVTETAAVTHPETVIQGIENLNDSGFTVSLDDFGTGYSSFSHFSKIAIRELKIDKDFLLDMNETSRLAVQSIIELAHKLDICVVAEGVETPELFSWLADVNCDYVQGYFVSRPLPIESLNDWLLESEWSETRAIPSSKIA